MEAYIITHPISCILATACATAVVVFLTIALIAIAKQPAKIDKLPHKAEKTNQHHLGRLWTYDEVVIAIFIEIYHSKLNYNQSFEEMILKTINRTQSAFTKKRVRIRTMIQFNKDGSRLDKEVYRQMRILNQRRAKNMLIQAFVNLDGDLDELYGRMPM